MMIENLPPLSALRVFEAAARHLNFTRAAAELGMTQAAVSYQIKLLEERMGAPLFLRQPKQLALTETGARLAPGIIEAFTLMRTTVAASRDKAHEILTISTMDTFASRWLMHRIGDFQLKNPDIAVKLETSNHQVDFAREPVDVAIRSGRGDWPGLESHLLVPADFTPMTAPQLAADLNTPADLLDIPLIDRDDVWWAIWFEAAGIAYPDASKFAKIRIASQTLVGELAMAGNGAAILMPVFFQSELQRGVLVQPFDLVCTRGFGYHLVYPQTRRNAPHIRAFRDWILSAVPQNTGSVTTWPNSTTLSTKN